MALLPLMVACLRGMSLSSVVDMYGMFSSDHAEVYCEFLHH